MTSYIPFLSISTWHNLEPVKTTNKDNLTQDERKALEDLKKAVHNFDIVLRSADKGNSIVLMNHDYYNEKLIKEQHLNTNAYRKVAPNSDKLVFKELEKIIEKNKSCLTKEEISFILNENWKLSIFNAYPKIHKSNILKEIAEKCENDYVEMDPPTDLKSRPVIAGPISPTQNASKLLERILTPIVSHQSTYIKDDWHFIKKIPRNLDFNCNLFGCDIESLYTSIDINLGLEAISYWVDHKRTLIPERFTKSFILELVEFVFSNNNFMHKDDFYHQVFGAAMGGSASPPYACLTVGYLEETKLFNEVLPNNFEPYMCNIIREHLSRYMDDGFVFLPIEIDKDIFLMCLNSLHDNLKFMRTSFFQNQ